LSHEGFKKAAKAGLIEAVRENYQMIKTRQTTPPHFFRLNTDASYCIYKHIF
jgi:hypothetical protein